MEYITFKQFIYTLNIRNFYINENKEDCNDNEIIRIHIESGQSRGNEDYIDFGWYDYFTKNTVWKILEISLNEKILNSKVTDISYSNKFKMLEIWIEENPEETLESN